MRVANLVGSLVLSAVVASCPGQDPVVYCNSARDCPGDQRCLDGRCVAAAPGVDAGGQDARGGDRVGVDRAPAADAQALDVSAAADHAPVDTAVGDGGATDHHLPVDATAPVDGSGVADAGAGDRALAADAAPDATPGDRASDDASALADGASLVDAGAMDAGAASPLSALELCGLYLSAAQVPSPCQQQPAVSTLLLDAEALARACRPGTAAQRWAADLLLAADQGRVRLDWDLAHACLDGSRSLRQVLPAYQLEQSPAWVQLQAGACHDFYAGLVDDGRSCRYSWDCQEGRGCYTLTPYTEGTTVCGLAAGAGGACSTAWPCAEGLYCDGQHCQVRKPPGESCTLAEECQSDVCDSSSCGPLPPAPVPLGGECGDGDTCEGSCSSCRLATPAASRRTCQARGAEGDFCLIASDCLDDLGCTEHRCTTVAIGAICDDIGGSRCAPGLACVHAIDCSLLNGNADACSASAPSCLYESPRCLPGARTCVASLPASGPCLPDGECAAGAYCDPARTCRTLAGVAQSCSTDGATEPRCGEGLVCELGRCAWACEVPADCPGGYCDSATQSCRPVASGSCSSDVECGPGARCAGDGTCASLLALGAPCTRDSECASGECLLDPAQGSERCAIDHIDGCIPTRRGEFVRWVFLLGSVLLVARRRAGRRG